MITKLWPTLLVLWLASCASIPPAEDTMLWAFDGKVSFRQGNETRVFAVDWSKFVTHSEIELSAALGAASATITLTDSVIRIQSGDMDETYAESDVFSLGGDEFQIPFKALEYWLRGRQNAAGTPVTSNFQASGWHVDILKSDDQGPRLLSISRGGVSLRLRIKRWHFAKVNSAAESI